MFSKRTDWDTQKNTLAEMIDDFQRQEIQFYDLTQSNPTRCNFQYLNSDLLSSLSDLNNLTYEPSARGIKRVRVAIAEYYRKMHDIQVDPERIFLTSGTSEAYSYLFKLLLNPGETILTFKPSYPLLDLLCDLHDTKQCVSRIALSAERWKLDYDQISLLLSQNHCKAIVLINPNNPTGSFSTLDTAKHLSDLASQYSSCIISDEVFLDYQMTSEKTKPYSFASNPEALTFTLSGVSKILGLPQMKLSWIVVSGPESLVDSACDRLEIVSDTYLSVGTPVQNALKNWMVNIQAIQSEIKNRIKSNLKILKNAANSQNRIKIIDSEGGWVSVILIKGILDDLRFCEELLRKKKALIHPGYLYDFDAEGFFVISLLPEHQVFESGITNLIQLLEETSKY